MKIKIQTTSQGAQSKGWDWDTQQTAATMPQKNPKNQKKHSKSNPGGEEKIQINPNNPNKQLPVIGTALLQGISSSHIPAQILLFQPSFEMKISCSASSAEKSPKSSPNFCSTHTNPLKIAFKTLCSLFQEMGQQQQQKKI